MVRITLLLLLVSNLAIGQSYNYKPLKAKGDVPADFTAGYFEKVKNQQDNLGRMSDAARKEEMSFHQYNEFMIDIYLTSGRVIYGDDITLYLNEVLDKVLAKDKDLRKEMRIYAVRDADFNAYTTNNGIIFVNVGLLGELETEAQLAFVLAHEVVHYVENHVRKAFNYKTELEKKKGNFTYDMVNLAKDYYKYSKDQELKADEDGYKVYFEHTGYSKLAPFELMDIMLFSYLPFDEIEFDVDIFSTATYGVYNSDLRDYIPKEISAREDVTDEMSTHPNIKARTEAIEVFLSLKEEGSNFLVSEERFLALREQARFECLEDFLTSAQYDRAIYQAFLLLQQYPEDDYLKRAIVYSVYSTAVYKNYDKLPEEISKINNVEGQLNHVRYILKSIDAEELNTLAVALCFEYSQSHPDDKLAIRMYKDALWELTHYHVKKLKNYETLPEPTDSTKVVEAQKEVELKTTGKVKRLKKITASGSIERKYAFSSYLADTNFTSLFEKMAGGVTNYSLEVLPRLATARDKNGEVQTLKEVRDRKKLPYGSYYVYPNKKENSGGHGVNQALVLTPESYTLSRKAQVDYEKTEKNRLNYTEALMNGAKLTDVSLTLFDYKGGNAEEAEKFNEMQTLQLWYDEHDNHDKVDVVQYLYYRVEPICESYNTNYLLYTGMLNINFSGFTVQRANDYSPLGKAMGDAILSLVLLPTLPFVYGTNYVPTYYSFQFMQAINLQNEKQVMFKGLEIQHFRTDAVINNLIYDQLNELSAKPKYKKK